MNNENVIKIKLELDDNAPNELVDKIADRILEKIGSGNTALVDFSKYKWNKGKCELDKITDEIIRKIEDRKKYDEDGIDLEIFYQVGKIFELNSKSQKENKIITRLYLYGRNDISVKSINPTGLPYIENYDFYKTEKYMSKELIDALNKNNDCSEKLTPELRKELDYFIRESVYIDKYYTEENLSDLLALGINRLKEINELYQNEKDNEFLENNTNCIKSDLINVEGSVAKQDDDEIDKIVNKVLKKIEERDAKIIKSIANYTIEALNEELSKKGIFRKL